MRIIAGNLGGRNFKSPSGHVTHPMSDKMRGALFNSLGNVSNLTVLDAFAGSAALGFEAASRGAAQIVCIEKDRAAQLAIADNIHDLQIGPVVKLIKAGIGSWLRTADTVFDIVLLDPPYDKLQIDLLNQLARRVASGGQLALSWPGKLDPPILPGLRYDRGKQYGDSSLHYYAATSR